MKVLSFSKTCPNFFSRCYSRALKILPESASLWHDLGLSFFYLSKEKSEQERHLFLDKSESCLKKAISLESDNHLHWTALGVIANSK